MSNFLVAIPGAQPEPAWRSLFRAGLRAADQLDYRTPLDRIDDDAVQAALYPREFGRHHGIARDPDTGSWLMVSGFWLCGPLASGQEGALLDRFLALGAASLTGVLEGPFMILLRDGRDGAIHLVTDLTGSHHVYRRELAGTTFLSGSSLLLAALDDVQLDPVACQEYLGVGNLFEQRSLYREISRLDPAAHYRFASGHPARVDRYWSAGKLQPDLLRGREAVRETTSRLQSVVQRVHPAAQRPVTDLTGGYDSRALFAAWTGAGLKPATFVSGAADSADVQIAARLSDLLGAEHLHYDKSDPLLAEHLHQACLCTDGEYDIVEYARIRNSQLYSCRRGYDLNTNGSFGEVARGYWWEILFPQLGRRGPLDGHLLARKRYVTGAPFNRLFPPGAQLDLVEHFAAIFGRVTAEVSGQRNTLQMDMAYLGMRMRSWQGRIASSSDRIRPNLSPFQCRSVLESLLQTYWRNRLGNRHMARLVQAMSPALASMPMEHGHPCQPIGPANLHRFWPLLKHLGGRVTRKLRRAAPAPASPDPDGPLAGLWSLDPVQELMRPGHMQLAALLDAEQLEIFLQQARQPGFTATGMWQRLLSIEYSQQLRRRAAAAASR